MSRRELTMSERCERAFNSNWKDPRDAEESAGAPKGSVAHQVEMAVVRETLRKVPSFTLYGDCGDCHKGECTMNCSSATFDRPCA